MPVDGLLLPRMARMSDVTVAPSNATDEDKQTADYVCTGTDDHLTLNEAVLTAAKRGVGVTLGGNITVDRPFHLPRGVKIWIPQP